MKFRRTLKQYRDLWRNPWALFPGGPDNRGAAVTLFPNGQNEIWISDGESKGFRIRASRGPHGLGLQISRFVGAPAMTIAANGVGESAGQNIDCIDTTDIEIVQYDATDAARAHREWYAGRGPYPVVTDTF